MQNVTDFYIRSGKLVTIVVWHSLMPDVDGT